MNKYWGNIFLIPCILFSMTSCSTIGEKTSSLSVIYGIAALLALLLIVGYCSLIRKKEIWFIFLFVCIFVVNTAYFALSISKSLEEALLANRFAYLGSVFLPLSMLMIIAKCSKLHVPKWLLSILLCISIIMFLIAASPGYLDIYCKSVELVMLNGESVLQKVYGPWHSSYLYYLIGYFSIIIGITFHAIIHRKIPNGIQALFLASAVFVNIGIWLIEQLVHINFELLSISYIISELFLLLLSLMIQENMVVLQVSANQMGTPTEKSIILDEKSQFLLEQSEFLTASLPLLTPTERIVYDYYLDGKASKEILALMNITENTLKYHNKNIYGKLGVSSRKQMLEIVCFMNQTRKNES